MIIFLKQIHPVVLKEKKRNDELDLNDDLYWNNIYRLNLNIAKNSKLQWFQHKINQRTLTKIINYIKW